MSYTVDIQEKEVDSGWISKVVIFENDNPIPKFIFGRELVMFPTRETTYYAFKEGEDFPTILDVYELRAREVIDEIINANTINHSEDTSFKVFQYKKLNHRRRILKFEQDAISQIKNIDELTFHKKDISSEQWYFETFINEAKHYQNVHL